MRGRWLRKWKIGGEIRYYKPTDVLGRIAAQMAKQVIFQKVREAERDTVFNEYNASPGRSADGDRQAHGSRRM